jgi:hypothetical protein
VFADDDNCLHQTTWKGHLGVRDVHVPRRVRQRFSGARIRDSIAL